MPDLSKKKYEMPVRPPEKRIKHFGEVAKGYTEALAKAEAARCLNCKNPPCVKGCPVNVRIPEFIKKITLGEYEDAYSIIKTTNSLPAVCGRVCPQESQCEAVCVRAKKGESVGIGRLERYVADRHNEESERRKKAPKDNLLEDGTKETRGGAEETRGGTEETRGGTEETRGGAEETRGGTEETRGGPKAAIIGSGPSGLSCAGALAQKGWDVTIFEALHTPGGVLVYGIPEFRLPKSVVEKEIEELTALGVKIETNVIIGKTLTIDELLEEGFEAVFIGTGAGLPKFMNIPGENYNGVYSANEYLTRVNLMKAYENSDTPVLRPEKAAVVGGGNVAMDAARSALRMGAKTVYILYRRSKDELPARAEEVEHAAEEGVIFKFLTNPVEITADEKRFVNGIVCVEMELGAPDATGRRRPVEKPGSQHKIDVDMVIMALGTTPNPLITATTKGLEKKPWGGIVADETGKTTKEAVYAGGDAVTGAATVILAMGAGRTAAEEIDRKMRERS